MSADIWNVWIGQSSLRWYVWMMLCVLSHCTAYSLTSTHRTSFLSSLHLKQKVTLLDLCINGNSFLQESHVMERGRLRVTFIESSLCSHTVCALTTHLRRPPLSLGSCVSRGEILCIIQLERGGSSIITKHHDGGWKKKRSSVSGGVHWVLIVSFFFYSFFTHMRRDRFKGFDIQWL